MKVSADAVMDEGCLLLAYWLSPESCCRQGRHHFIGRAVLLANEGKNRRSSVTLAPTSRASIRLTQTQTRLASR